MEETQVITGYDELLYLGEHVSCTNYCRNGRSPAEIFDMSPGKAVERELEDAEITLILKGSISIPYPGLNSCIERGSIILFPPGVHIVAEAIEECRVLVCRLDDHNERLCEAFSLENLYKPGGGESGGCVILRSNSAVRDFADFMCSRLDDGLRCSSFLKSKVSELLILLRAYYPREMLAGFFAPILSRDISFRKFVMLNYQSVSSVSEFADKANYSRNGFARQFKRVMGKPPYQWLREEKAKLVLHDLRYTHKTIKDISEEYGFSSVSRFTEFCNEFFDMPPARLRKVAGG